MKNAELIARLKEQCDRDAAEHCPAEIIALQAEGIATIEKLEAEVERLKEANSKLASSDLLQSYEAMQAENAKLRDQLAAAPQPKETK